MVCTHACTCVLLSVCTGSKWVWGQWCVPYLSLTVMLRVPQAYISQLTHADKERRSLSQLQASALITGKMQINSSDNSNYNPHFSLALKWVIEIGMWAGFFYYYYSLLELINLQLLTFLNKLPYNCIVRPSDNWQRIVRERKKLCPHDKCAGLKSG